MIHPPPPETPRPAALCVLGMGLIGSSLMRAARGLVPVTGWSPTAATRQSATDDGFVVSPTLDEALDGAVRDDALVVLASPVTAFGPLLTRIGQVAPRVLLTDVGGVKAPVATQVAELAPGARYIGSHPMTGTQYSGWAAGSATLFDGATWVTCLEEDSHIEDWAMVAGLALLVGSTVVPAEAGEHDAAVARVSHLPHLLALALAQVGEHGGALAMSLAAGSFRDGTRVAATRPELVRAMCETNRWPLVDALDDALGLLGVARGSLASTGSLAKLAEGGYQARQVFEQRDTDLERLALSGDDLAEQLLAVGASGGRVTDIARDRDGGLTVTARYPAG